MFLKNFIACFPFWEELKKITVRRRGGDGQSKIYLLFPIQSTIFFGHFLIIQNRQ